MSASSWHYLQHKQLSWCVKTLCIRNQMMSCEVISQTFTARNKGMFWYYNDTRKSIVITIYLPYKEASLKQIPFNSDYVSRTKKSGFTFSFEKTAFISIISSQQSSNTGLSRLLSSDPINIHDVSFTHLLIFFSISVTFAPFAFLIRTMSTQHVALIPSRTTDDTSTQNIPYTAPTARPTTWASPLPGGRVSASSLASGKENGVLIGPRPDQLNFYYIADSNILTTCCAE